MYQQNADYPTDKFGRPDGRDYTYRIPRNRRIPLWRASRHLHGLTERLVTQLRDHDGNTLYYIVIQTRDSKGPLDGLSEFQYSSRWERPFSHGRSHWEIRAANGGGTKIRGPFPLYDRFGGRHTLQFDTTISLTVSEVREVALGMASVEQRESFERAIRFAQEDAISEFHERVSDRQDACSHEEVVRDPDAGHSAEAVGFCEQCFGVINDENEVIASTFP